MNWTLKYILQMSRYDRNMKTSLLLTVDSMQCSTNTGREYQHSSDAHQCLLPGSVDVHHSDPNIQYGLFFHPSSIIDLLKCRDHIINFSYFIF